MKIILATTNKDKFKDFRLLVRDIGLRPELPEEEVEVRENKSTLLANAKKKALTYSKKYENELVAATDGGVKIPYLGESWNHVLTKRLSGRDMEEGCTERERCEVLLDLMKDATGKDRKVFWKEAFAIACNNKIIYSFEGISEPGYIMKKIPDDFKETGFWVGYIWYKPKFKKHYMALTDKEKKRIGSVGNKFVIDLKKNLDKVRGAMNGQ